MNKKLSSSNMRSHGYDDDFISKEILAKDIKIPSYIRKADGSSDEVGSIWMEIYFPNSIEDSGNSEMQVCKKWINVGLHLRAPRNMDTENKEKLTISSFKTYKSTCPFEIFPTLLLVWTY